MFSHQRDCFSFSLHECIENRAFWVRNLIRISFLFEWFSNSKLRMFVSGFQWWKVSIKVWRSQGVQFQQLNFTSQQSWSCSIKNCVIDIEELTQRRKSKTLKWRKTRFSDLPVRKPFKKWSWDLRLELKKSFPRKHFFSVCWTSWLAVNKKYPITFFFRRTSFRLRHHRRLAF